MHAGEVIVSDVPPTRGRSAVGLDWPGRGEGLGDPESEILALITINAGSRTQAVLWGIKHGFTPDHNGIEHWRGGP